jgi:membrane-associated phospholipid phosphatase
MRNVARRVRSPLALAAVLFVALALLVLLKLLTAFDRSVYDATQPFGSGAGDLVASAVTLLGRTDIAVGIGILAAVVLALRRRGLFPNLAPIAVMAIPPLVDAIKSALGQHRPPAGTGHDLLLIPSLLPKAAGETLSFPSNHAALAGFLATVLVHLVPRSGPFVWALAIAVALSRLYLDKHWASDVVGGLLLGIVAGELTWLIALAAERMTLRRGTK